MRVYLVQHGEARPKSEDPERNLSEKGVSDANRMAAFLHGLKLELAVVNHSGKPRAARTADILGRAVKIKDGIVQRQGIAPMDPVNPLIQELSTTDDDRMLVGHLPFMNRLASALAAGSDSADAVAFRPAGVVCLERDDPGKWRLLWSMIPELLG